MPRTGLPCSIWGATLLQDLKPREGFLGRQLARLALAFVRSSCDVSRFFFYFFFYIFLSLERVRCDRVDVADRVYGRPRTWRMSCPTKAAGPTWQDRSPRDVREELIAQPSPVLAPRDACRRCPHAHGGGDGSSRSAETGDDRRRSSGTATHTDVGLDGGDGYWPPAPRPR